MSDSPHIHCSKGEVQRNGPPPKAKGLYPVMLNLKKPVKQYYSEAEALHTLCISLEALHQILDDHVFTPEHPRPGVLEFTHAELLLLSVWAKPERGHNVLAMPNRS
jgi:hypothetical protein